MNSVIKSGLITLVVMGIIFGSILGLAEIEKYENSINPPAPYDTGRCDPRVTENCLSAHISRTPEMEKSLDDWAKSQSPIHADKPLG